MNITVIGIYCDSRSEKDLVQCMQNLSRISEQLGDKIDVNHLSWIIEFGYPPGGGWCISSEIQRTSDLPIAKEVEAATGLHGSVRVCISDLEVNLKRKEMTGDEIASEVARIVPFLK